MRIPRKYLIPSWITLSVLAYYTALDTYWGNYYHGGGPWGAVFFGALAVLAVFVSLEVARSDKSAVLRVFAVLFAAPFALYVGLTLYYGVLSFIR